MATSCLPCILGNFEVQCAKCGLGFCYSCFMRNWTGGQLCHAKLVKKKSAEASDYPSRPFGKSMYDDVEYAYLIFPTPQDSHIFRYLKYRR